VPRAACSILALILTACAAAPPATAPPAAREAERSPTAARDGWIVVAVPVRHQPAWLLTEVLQELLASAHGISCSRTHCYPQPSSVRAWCVPFLETVLLFAPLSALDGDLPDARVLIDRLDAPAQ